jgi:DNA processing protein
MSLAEPHLVPRATFAALRPHLAAAVRFEALWTAGEVTGLQRTSVAIVGSRAPSEAGRRLAFETGRRLAQAGLCVVSGLALGIDGAAHAGAIEAGSRTIGVLGGGHRAFHPRRNRRLAERMIDLGGAVVSPYAPDVPARPWQFLQRNGVVVALADAVVVVEAAARSGALNTASWAGDLGIPVFAFPGDVDRPKVAGCLALLRDGATLARSADDILADLGVCTLPFDAAPHAGTLTAARTPFEARLLTALAPGEADLDALVERCAEPAATLLAALTTLELEGVVERRPGPRFALLSGRSAAAPSMRAGRCSIAYSASGESASATSPTLPGISRSACAATSPSR